MSKIGLAFLPPVTHRSRRQVRALHLPPFPRRLPPVEYPDHFEVRRVALNGNIRWKGRSLSVSSVLGDEPIGLEAIDNGIWALYFGPVRFGTLDDRTFTTTDD
jgi:hypothetical protein